MPRFILFIHASADSKAGKLPSTEMIEAMTSYNEQLSKAGVLLAGEGLHPSSAGAIVNFFPHPATHPPQVKKGPFGKPEDLVAGFWIIKADSLDEAVEWVKKCPLKGAETQIEVRRIIEASDFGDTFTPELQQKEKQLRKEVEERNEAL